MSESINHVTIATGFSAWLAGRVGLPASTDARIERQAIWRQWELHRAGIDAVDHAVAKLLEFGATAATIEGWMMHLPESEHEHARRVIDRLWEVEAALAANVPAMNGSSDHG